MHALVSAMTSLSVTVVSKGKSASRPEYGRPCELSELASPAAFIVTDWMASHRRISEQPTIHRLGIIHLLFGRTGRSILLDFLGNSFEHISGVDQILYDVHHRMDMIHRWRIAPMRGGTPRI